MVAIALAQAASAQTGKPFIHDPSTIQECDGKYYTFGTGQGGVVATMDESSPCGTKLSTQNHLTSSTQSL